MMVNLIRLFHSLNSISVQPGKSDFAAIPIPGHEPHRIGKDVQDRPLLLVAIPNVPGHGHPAPIILENLTVMYDLKCRVTRQGVHMKKGDLR